MDAAAALVEGGYGNDIGGSAECCGGIGQVVRGDEHTALDLIDRPGVLGRRRTAPRGGRVGHEAIRRVPLAHCYLGTSMTAVFYALLAHGAGATEQKQSQRDEHNTMG